MRARIKSFFSSLSGSSRWVRIKSFFFPPPGSSRWARLAPYLILGVIFLLFLTAGSYAWDYTNSPVFCGTTCHTMPPEYAAYQVSPHARVDCVDCHIGRGFIATKISRKAGDVEHVVDTVFNNYSYPIFANKLRPARETCEKCHFPEKFSDDSLRTNVHYANDQDNTKTSVVLALKTGGGSKREGLGLGIHWHVENEVYFAATDDLQQDIPYVRVVNADGSSTEYISLNSKLTREQMTGLQLQRMDCITCHNRITHNILPPDQAIDKAIAQKQIAQDIPFIHKNAVDVLSVNYKTKAEAETAIKALADTYAKDYPDYVKDNKDKIDGAVNVLLSIYEDTNFPDQQDNWQTHPNNVGHTNWPGCWRCHDGQHVSQPDNKAIRLECNLCHSIPQVITPTVLEPKLPLSNGLEPDSHLSTHWIFEHRKAFDQTCQACHTVSNPGGTDNSSFCSNSACHGQSWKFAGLDAPGLAELAAKENPNLAATPTPGPVTATDNPTFDGQVKAIFASKCLACHSKSIATGGLVLEDYNSVMTGGKDGAVIIVGNPEGSLLIQKQQQGHFGKLSDDELKLVITWIKNGAPQN